MEAVWPVLVGIGGEFVEDLCLVIFPLVLLTQSGESANDNDLC